MKTKYILITPVHNEQELIEGLIKCVIAQTIHPQKWVIVDDDSTDGTSEIIKCYEAQHNFITCLRLKRGDIESYYSRRVHVVLAGIEATKTLKYDFLGVLDADITLESTYYEGLLKEFDLNPKLGIASGIYVDKVSDQLQKVLIDVNHSPGALHMFRCQCYEQIGGYVPQKYGGDDSCAEIMARMKGWETRSFPQYQAIHHRPTGTTDGAHILAVRFQQGLAEYSLGTHPIFMLAKSLRRAALEKPYIIGSVARMGGFLCGCLRHDKKEILDTAVSFVRKEQTKRLFSYLRKHG